MKLNLILAACAAVVLCAACNQNTASSGAGSCPDDGAPLPGTGLCQHSAAALIERADGAREEQYGENCTSVINEVMLPADQALLYGAAQCGERETQLAFAGGAHSAEISIQQSALYEGPTNDPVVIRLFGVDPDPRGALNQAIAELPPAQRATCEIRSAGVEGWPSDALVIAPTAAERARLPQDEPVAVCGPMGYDEDSISYWRVRQGFAWFYALGQESQGFDAASVTLIQKQPDGSWLAVP